MLRMYLVQAWFNLSDEGVEDAIYDSYALRKFVGVDFLREQVPDATTLLHFRHLLEESQLGRAMFEGINRFMDETGHIMHGDTIIDATIINAPSSTKNAKRARDPEMHQTKKGNEWRFGMKIHVGVDAGTGAVVADTGVYPERVLADKAYRSRENHQYCKERGIRMSGPKLGRPPKDKALYRQQLLEERLESGERSAIESFFGVGKRRYVLNLVMERLRETSEVTIHTCILTMNLWKRLRELLFVLFRRALQAPTWCREPVVMSLLVVLCERSSLKTLVIQ